MGIPDYILKIIEKLQSAGYEAYIVGGCVRDILLSRKPSDWDVTTDARPEQILSVFPEAKYENKFGTVLLAQRVGARDKDSKGELIDVVEITTYRSEQNYSDRRHPDEIRFETKLDKDLERRDFTINALALDPVHNDKIIDYFGGRKDIKAKIIRAVGEPSDRFKEDALRMIRAIRFSSQLGFKLEPKTQRAIVKLAGGIKFVSQERIRDELIKILFSDRPAEGIMLLQDTKLLQYIIPELIEGIGVGPARHHLYPVFKHNIMSLKYCPSLEWPVRLAALLHDIAKPRTRKTIKGVATFYNHEYLGAKMVNKIMTRLKFSNKDKERVVNLVKNHMFYYNVGEVSAASVRRLLFKVGPDNLQDLIHLRVADRLGSGTPKAMPYKLRHLQYMLEKVQHDPISVKKLDINGDDLIKYLKIKAGPKIGAILDVLLSEIIEDVDLNNKEYLLQRAEELNKLNLSRLVKKAKDIIKDKQEADDQAIKKHYKVS